MVTEIVNDYDPHEGQQAFHDSKTKFKAAITGIGWGKSCAGANELIINAMQYPRSVHCILAPNSKIMNNATLVQFWKFCPKEFIREHKRVANEIYLINGSKIVYLTADNERHIDRLRGIEIGSFWADEAALFLGLLWDVLLGRLRSQHGPL